MGRRRHFGNYRCEDGRAMRHTPAADDPSLGTDVGPCEKCDGQGCAQMAELEAVTDLQRKVLPLLEAAGLPTESNDAVMLIISWGEKGLVPCDVCGEPVDAQADACPHCG